MIEEGKVELGIHFVDELIAELDEKSPARATLTAVRDRALRWELLGHDGQGIGRYSRFPRNEAEKDATGPEDTFKILDRHTGEIHVRILTRWTTQANLDRMRKERDAK